MVHTLWTVFLPWPLSLSQTTPCTTQMGLVPTDQDSNPARTQIGTWAHWLLVEITYLVSGLHGAQVPDVYHRKNSVRDKMIGKKWINLERYTFHRQNVSKGKSSPREWGHLGKWDPSRAQELCHSSRGCALTPSLLFHKHLASWMSLRIGVIGNGDPARNLYPDQLRRECGWDRKGAGHNL